MSQRYSGTVTHMPPELIEDGKVYQQGDVYAFGIMMWEVRERSAHGCARMPRAPAHQQPADTFI